MLPYRIYRPLAGEPRLSQSSSPRLQPHGPLPTASGPSLADAHPCAKHVQGGVGAGEHMQLSQKQKHRTLTLKLQ